MARFYALALLVLFAGCNPDPVQNCDYCRAPRSGVMRFLCDKCSKPHAACDSEKSILHYTEAGKTARGYTYYSATAILTCPAPPEAALVAEPLSEKPEKPESPDPKMLTPYQRAALVALLTIVSLCIGYSFGKMRRGMAIKLENKKGVVS